MNAVVDGRFGRNGRLGVRRHASRSTTHPQISVTSTYRLRRYRTMRPASPDNGAARRPPGQESTLAGRVSRSGFSVAPAPVRGAVCANCAWLRTGAQLSTFLWRNELSFFLVGFENAIVKNALRQARVRLLKPGEESVLRDCARLFC